MISNQIRRKNVVQICSRFYSNKSKGKKARQRVVVTGMGAITPLGNNVNSSWNQLIKGGCAISKLDDDYKNIPCRIAARVNKSDLNIESTYSKSELKSLSTATLFSLLAAKEAIESAGLSTITENTKFRTGVCVGMGMFDFSDVYSSHQDLSKGYNRLSPYFIPRILPNMGAGQISIKYGFKGPNHSVSTACATGAHSIGDGFRFIKNGDADIMICGSGEACINPLSVAGFCRLRGLSTSYNDQPEKSSRPFDSKRDGFVMGEGSAILVLEELQHALERNANIHAEILGYGLSGDAYHLTSPSPDGVGARLAMQRAIQDASVRESDIYYINAHATSTPTGDIIEARAIETVFKSNLKDIVVSSTKGAHGHLLGAAGNVETVFTILSCQNRLIPPSINIDCLDKDIHFTVPQSAAEWKPSRSERRIALKNSFGFGGTNACLCISNYVD